MLDRPAAAIRASSTDAKAAPGSIRVAKSIAGNGGMPGKPSIASHFPAGPLKIERLKVELVRALHSGKGDPEVLDREAG